VAIHVEAKELVRQLGSGHFMNSIVMIGRRRQEGAHPAQGRRAAPGHRPPAARRLPAPVEGRKIHVDVPVVFVNEEDSPGLKKGGVLNVVRHELELVCESDKIPDEIRST
jgi:large subunit ribosomal protein L25